MMAVRNTQNLDTLVSEGRHALSEAFERQLTWWPMSMARRKSLMSRRLSDQARLRAMSLPGRLAMARNGCWTGPSKRRPQIERDPSAFQKFAIGVGTFFTLVTYQSETLVAAHALLPRTEAQAACFEPAA